LSSVGRALLYFPLCPPINFSNKITGRKVPEKRKIQYNARFRRISIGSSKLRPTKESEKSIRELYHRTHYKSTLPYMTGVSI